ncbi:hypothetical protein LTR08_006760 [Meristemomyces frigidus]|nr:hypothetical protein LTR08_006760 [Meristemomyces frigidus]
MNGTRFAGPLGGGDGASDGGYASLQTSSPDVHQCDLYIPAPANLTRDQAYAYHLTTRNFFAYATAKPIVGEKLGLALTGLLERIREWQPQSAALANFTWCCQVQGYEDMAHNVDYAIACLTLAEHAQLRDLWVESFAHCVGMREELEQSIEWDSISNRTKALIARASLEMDMHIERVVRALGSFLEDELGPDQLGLTKPARDHLDRFRSCLHNYYVDKLGYFPPNEEGPWNKRLWTKMYHSFHNLYEYLVDYESSTDHANIRVATGGICVAQNVQAFDERHGYAALPHPLPLLPTALTRSQTSDAQKGLRSFRLGRSEATSSLKVTAKQALVEASNVDDPDVMACELVQEYRRFEWQKLEEKLTVAEARKVRWLLIYGVLQMLSSIVRAPNEVRDIENPSYPMCVLTVGSPEFEDCTAQFSRKRSSQQLAEDALLPKQTNDSDDKISIHPDCEAESAEGYFSPHTLSRRASQLSLDMTPPPLRITTQLSKTASIRSSVHAMHRSFVGSLTRRNTGSSLRKTAIASSRPLSKTSSFCEILVEGYGNGMDAESNPDHLQDSCCEEGQAVEEPSNIVTGFDFGLDDVSEEPSLEDGQLDNLLDSPVHQCYASDSLARTPSDCSLSATDSNNSGSSRSSAYFGGYDTPATEVSFWDGDASTRHSATKLSVTSPASCAESGTPSPVTRHSWQQKRFNFGHMEYGVKTNCYSVNAGCYAPTGRPIILPTSKFSQSRAHSTDSADSAASSQYPERRLQAAEIEEEEMRGRRRSRGLDRISLSDLHAESRLFCLDE